MSRIIRSYIVDIVETDDVIYCDKDGHLTYNIEADRNELVRCESCVYCEPYAVDTGEDCMTGLWCEKNQKDTTLQDYCSYGERRE